jgi:CO dehydrogenase nickel-insertion accessory protein CooC1
MNSTSNETTTNPVYIVGGGKGGVGKSIVTIALVNKLREENKLITVIESDESNPDAYKTLNEHITCEVCDINDEAGFVRAGNIIESNDTHIVMNTPARSTQNLIDYASIISAVTRSKNRELILLWPISKHRDCLELLHAIMQNNPGFNSIYVIINTYFGHEVRFTRYDASNLKQNVTGTIVFPELTDTVCDKMTDLRLPLWTDSKQLTIAERSAIYRYKTAVNLAMERLK